MSSESYGASEPSLAERLGFASEARVAIVHADDIGMCHAANEGAFEALARGVATCGSVMVPCPWFREAAAHVRGEPELDIGVHLTLNAEWEHYRWGPVLGRTAVPSLVDDQGALPRTVADVLARAKPEEVERELRAQIETALEAGIDVTHLDSHMGTVFFPPLGPVYAKLAREFDLPVFAIPPTSRALEGSGLEPFADPLREVVGELAAAGVPILDGFDANSLGFARGDGERHNLARLSGLAAGVSYLICHPARDGVELAAITEDAHCRDFERAFYGGEAGRRAFAELGIERIGMRPLRELMRSGRS